MKTQIFWYVMKCRWASVSRRFVASYGLYLQHNLSKRILDPEDESITIRRNTVNYSPTTRHHIPEDPNVHEYCCANLKYRNKRASSPTFA
jgi:hypothetical protein